MRTILLINEEEIALNEPATFIEGEQVMLQDKSVKKVMSITKILTIVGGTADVAYQVRLQ